MNVGWIIAIIIAVIIVVLLAVAFAQRRRTQGLQERFGPEYQRAVAREGDVRSAESQLSEREQRHGELEIVELDPGARARYQEAWRATQGKFVDDPAGATREADVLVARVMRDRGYPVDDFERRVDDISVDHPTVAENYREAHAVSRANERGLASTDDLRQAFVHYRSLFVELRGADGDARTTDADARTPDGDARTTDADARTTDADARTREAK
jgi:hypothetical protein